MSYNFDTAHDRMGSDCLKWEKQLKFGQTSGLLPFWIADTDFATLPETMDAMAKRLEHPLFGYTVTGPRTLETVRGWYARRHGVDLPVEAFLPSVGVVTAMWFSIRALTKPGDQVLAFTPVYDPFFAIIENQGRVLADCPLTYENGRYDINWADFEGKLKNGVKAVLFCNPANPVGRVWSAQDVERVVVLCKQHGVYLLSDEIYGDIVLYGNKYTSAAKYKDIYDQMIIYTAISKTFNMAGLHSSCMLIPNLEQDVGHIFYTSGTTSAPKAVMSTQCSRVNSGIQQAHDLGASEKDHFCVAMPIFHCFCLSVNVMATCSVGACLYLPQGRRTGMIKAVSEGRCTVLSSVLTLFHAILCRPDFKEWDLSSLRTGFIGGQLLSSRTVPADQRRVRLHPAVQTGTDRGHRRTLHRLSG